MITGFRLHTIAFAFLTLAPSARLSAQTGIAVPELDLLERRVSSVIQKYRLPGASFALARSGKLVYARGFGLADKERQLPVKPESLFRIGSVSKPLTALTLLKLQEMGSVNLDDKVFDILPEYRPVLRDPRMRQITVRQLLHHTAGWDASVSGDPSFPSHDDIVQARASFPPTTDQVIQTWLQQPLDQNPGAAYHYSNFGFLLAGRVIEKVSGKTYRDCVRDLVLEPQGITHARVGRTLDGQNAPEEVRYYDIYSRSMTSIFVEAVQQTPLPYGAFSMDVVDSAGGWIASAPDLVRLLTAVNGTRGNLLRSASFQQFVERPAGLAPEASWYGLGIVVAPANGGFNFLHDGGIPGTHALFASFSDGTAFAFLTNTNPGDDDASEFDNDLASAVVESIASVKQWPVLDQFPSFFPSAPAPRVRGVASAASFQAGAVSPGEVLSLFGTGLGSTAGSVLALEGGRVAKQLDGIRIFFDATPAPILYSQDGQANVVAPFDIGSKKDVVITVDNKGVWSAPASTGVVPTRPATFTRGDVAAAINIDGTIHGATNAATRGTAVALYVTGLGLPRAAVEDGGVATGTQPMPAKVPSVLLDGRAVPVLYAGPAPGLVFGVWQINVQIPGDVRTGPVMLELRADQSFSRTTLFIK